MAWNVVIAGGGFGGFYAARTLDRVLPANSARIRVVNDVNFMLYTPLLPGAAAGTLEPRHVVVPLREQLSRGVDLRLGRILGAAPERNKLLIENLEGEPEELAYDHLIVTVGSVSRTLPVPGLAEHAAGFKSLAEAISLRNHVLRTLEMAETLEDGDARREHLTYVFVGAGYAGLEGIAELQDFVGDVLGALSALSRDRDALGPRRGQRSRHARDRPEARRVRDARAARARDRDPHEHHARRGHGAHRYKTKGVFVDMGRREAVAETLGLRWSGSPAWILPRTNHLAMMPGLGRRASLLVDWNIGLLFGRDTAELGGLGPTRALGATTPADGAHRAVPDGVVAEAVTKA